MDFWSQKKLLLRLYKDIGNIPLPHGQYFQTYFFPYFSSLRSISGGTSFTNLLRGLASFDALFLTVAIMSFGLPKISPYYFEHIFQHIMVIGIVSLFTFGNLFPYCEIFLKFKSSVFHHYFSLWFTSYISSWLSICYSSRNIWKIPCHYLSIATFQMEEIHVTLLYLLCCGVQHSQVFWITNGGK